MPHELFTQQQAEQVNELAKNEGWWITLAQGQGSDLWFKIEGIAQSGFRSHDAVMMHIRGLADMGSSLHRRALTMNDTPMAGFSGQVVEFEDFKDSVRNGVLDALDQAALNLMGGTQKLGWQDQELPALFKAVDAQARYMAARLNATPVAERKVYIMKEVD